MENKRKTDWLFNRVTGIDGLREHIVSFLPDVRKRAPAKFVSRDKLTYRVPGICTYYRSLQRKSLYYFPSIRQSYGKIDFLQLPHK